MMIKITLLHSRQKWKRFPPGSRSNQKEKKIIKARWFWKDPFYEAFWPRYWLKAWYWALQENVYKFRGTFSRNIFEEHLLVLSWRSTARILFCSMKGLLVIFFVPGASNMSERGEETPRRGAAHRYSTRKCHATAASNSSWLRLKLITQATLASWYVNRTFNDLHMQPFAHAAIHRNLSECTWTAVHIYGGSPTQDQFSLVSGVSTRFLIYR